jgi:hypothetical protein
MSDEDRTRWRRRLATALPFVQLALFLAIKLPVWLVVIGGTGHGPDVLWTQLMNRGFGTPSHNPD